MAGPLPWPLAMPWLDAGPGLASRPDSSAGRRLGHLHEDPAQL